MLAAEKPECAPDLPRERRHRGFAAGAGHRSNGPRLTRVELGRDQRQGTAGIGNADESGAAREAASSGARSAIIAIAPAAIAGATKRKPSALPPAIATNRSPRLTVRLSAVTPPISSSAWRASNSASGGNISRSFMVARSTVRPPLTCFPSPRPVSADRPAADRGAAGCRAMARCALRPRLRSARHSSPKS